MLACNKKAEAAQESSAAHTVNDDQTTSIENITEQTTCKDISFCRAI